ncbi:HigA family addiction module antidote protein [bacterium]|nr:HigA family addiction module antidote protein [bacterium]
MLPENRQPTHPGEILRYEYLEELNMTQQKLSDTIVITRVRINEILLGKRSITPDAAFRLSKFFNTTPEFWIRLQTNYDMWNTL